MGRIKIIVFLICVFLMLLSCEGKKKESDSLIKQTSKIAPTDKKVLVSKLAGNWYSNKKEELEKELAVYLDNADYKGQKNIKALILPHAGYKYSGGVAAYGIKQITNKSINRVIILGPSHRYYLENNISVPPFTHYRTPLGEIPLDTKFMEKLSESCYVKSIGNVHEYEHSVQIELPLLQMVLGEFTLVPIVVGRLNEYVASEIAKILHSLIDNETFVIVSSDFCHYGENYGYVPFIDDIEENIKRLDMRASFYIQNKDASGFYNFLSETGATICGRYAIGILLFMLSSNFNVQIMHYDTSGRITGDFSNSVSYFSISFSGEWDKKGNPLFSESGKTLSAQEKKNLLRLARKTLEYYLKHKRYPEPVDLGVKISPMMKEVRGGFVTLHKDGALRGCIGDILPKRPLYSVIMAHAVNAAVNDRRFNPVSTSELDAIEFEISALTAPEPISSYKEIVLGKHGIVLEKNGHSAVFLPQVAPEQGWNIDQTLSYLSRKAGLSKDAWKQGASFFVFKANVFSETNVHIN